MKYYSTHAEHKELFKSGEVKFILGYETKNRDIIIKFANGEYSICRYTEEKEAVIVKTMKEQARNIKVKPLEGLEKFNAILCPIMIPIASINFLNWGGWLYALFLVIALLSAYRHTVMLIQKVWIKMVNYCLNEKLNDNDQKSQYISLDKTKTTENEKQKPYVEKPIFVNDYSSKDLKEFRDNLLKIIDSNSPDKLQDTNEKGKVKTKFF